MTVTTKRPVQPVCKHWSRSRTVLINAAAAALGVLALLVDAFEPHADTLRSVTPDRTGAWIMIALSVANILLRLATAVGLRIRKPKIAQPSGRQRRARSNRRPIEDQQPTSEKPYE